MSKFLILGDLHFRKCRSKEENKYRLNVLQFISDYMKLNKISHIIQLGDFFHDRKSVDVSLDNEVQNIFDKYFNSILESFEIVTGNHDVYYNNRNDISSLEMLKNIIPSLHITDEPDYSEVYKMTFLPWLNENNAEKFNEFLSKPNKYCFGHLEINGFEMMRGILAKDSLEVSSFRHFDRVFSGHYHLTQDKGNITYVGSVFQNDFGDYGDIKRFFVLDQVKDEIEEVKIPFIFFDKIIINNEKDIDDCKIESYKDKNIQVVLNILSSIKRENFISKISEILTNYNVIDNSQLCSEKVEISADEDLNNIFTDYISQNKEYDERKKESLQSLFLETYKKVVNI